MSSLATPAADAKTPAEPFSRYEIFVIALIAFIQFTIILDFMILSPLGAMLLQDLHVTTAQFGVAVSGYAISAGLSGLLAAGFADRFDRKHLLLFFYAGFVLGTLLCALATSYQFLFVARVVTGFFGGVIGAVSMAIVADLFPLHRRGRVMGFVMTAFAGAQVLGLPLGLWLANHFGWHSGFYFIVAVSTVVGFVIVFRLKPVDTHLGSGPKRHPFHHLWLTALNRHYMIGFAATILLSTGGFMLMPFGSTFTVNNLGISFAQLPMIYLVTGIASIVSGPLLGRLSDTVGKYQMFVIASLIGLALVLFYTRLGVTPLWEVIALNIVLYSCITARMVSAGALTSGVPAPSDRGAYMSISSSLQQLSGGVAAWVAGNIVTQLPSGELIHYATLGLVVGSAMLVSTVLMYQVHHLVKNRPAVGAPSAAVS